ncbi:MAG: hypothetical protein LBD20_08565 [Spirochaetaceae bacterium]|jgi:hypothetical protein|nr:hypothetical protein [Spirochaetaceae bacterium]
MMQSRILYGWVRAVFAVSILSVWFATCKPIDPEEDIEGLFPVAASLTAFSVKLGAEAANAESILSPNFNAETRTYDGVIEDSQEGQTLYISASAEAGNVVEILINGASFKSAGEAVSVSTSCAAPSPGSSVSITARAYKKGVSPPSPSNQRNYTVTVDPGQLDDENNNDLALLYVGHTEQSGNKLVPQLETGVTSGYEVVADSGVTSGFVKVSAASKQADVEIFYNDEKISSASTEGKVQATFQMPGPGAQDKTLEVVVTAKRNGQPYPKTYTVVVKRYQLQDNAYSGTVSLAPSVTNAYSGIEITGVTAIGAGATQRAAQLDKSQANCTWSFNTEEAWAPIAFTITLTKSDGTAMESMSYPYVPPSKTNIGLEVSDPNELGIRIFSPYDFYYYLNSNEYKNYNFALANNIDLSKYKDAQGNVIDWTGPSGYSGTLYGNGYSVKNLVLSKNESNTGNDVEKQSTALFKTLGQGAVLRDFNIEVSIKDSAKDRKSHTYFGSVVGSIYLGGGSVTLRGIKTKGTLDFTTQDNGFLIVGGFIGEIGSYGTINIENCGSELNASVESYTRNEGGRLADFGGFIGRIVSNGGNTLTINIKNSYASGDMSVAGTTVNPLFCGGLIGDVLNNNGGATLNLDITNCYAAGNIAVVHTGGAANEDGLGAGGLIGFVATTGGSINLTLTNCAAVGKEVLLGYSTPTSGQVKNSRFVALSTSLTSPSSVTIDNGIARKGMLIGAGTQDDSEGGLDQESGLGKTDIELETEATWTGAGWSAEVWDFSGLSEGKWPTLK